MRQSTLQTPPHLAIIMDGNGRWAERRGQPRSMGHLAGARVMRDVVGLARGFTDQQGRLHLEYSARNDGRTLSFDDVLELRPDGTVVNTIEVSYLLLPVGEAQIHFHKR